MNSFCFMGRLRFLRPIEFSYEDAILEEQKFSVKSILEVTDEKDANMEIIHQIQEEEEKCPNIPVPSKLVESNAKFPTLEDQPKKVMFLEKDKIVFKDHNLSVYPLRLISSENNDEECFSFICIPN